MIKDVIITKQDIKARVSALAKEINNTLSDVELIIVCVLKGSVFFTADLIRCISNKLLEKSFQNTDPSIRLEFVQVCSYGDNAKLSGLPIIQYSSVEMAKGNELLGKSSQNGKGILIVDDILNTGLTLKILIQYYQRLKPLFIKTCVLLDKGKTQYKADYMGFRIQDDFVVGYGLDYQEHYRGLPYIAVLRNTD